MEGLLSKYFNPNILPLDAFDLKGVEGDEERVIGLKAPWKFEGESVSYPKSGYVSGRGWWVELADGTLLEYGYYSSYGSLPSGVGGWKVIKIPIPVYSKDVNMCSCGVICTNWGGLSAALSNEQPGNDELAVYNRQGFSGDTSMYWFVIARRKP